MEQFNNFSLRTVKIILAATALALFVAALASLGGFAPDAVRAAAGDNVSGWAWSDTIGWIKFNNCTDPDDPATCEAASAYGVDVDVTASETGGNISGYAWSDAIGWIRFDPSAADGYPAVGPNNGAKIEDWTNTAVTQKPVTGWARACAVFQIGCAGTLKNDTARGGWDGWIKMSDSSWDPDGVTFNATTNKFEGYAWGSDVIGWISFNCDNDASCGTSSYAVVLGASPPAPVVPSVTISAPANVTSGAPFSVTATVRNLAGETCTDTGSTDDWWNDSTAIPDDDEAITVPISGIIAETVYALACGETSALPITVSVDPFITSFTANGYSSATYIQGSSPVTLAWDTANVTTGDCSIDNGIGSVSLSGSTFVTPGAETTYKLSCTGSPAFSNSPQEVTVHHLFAGFILEPPRHEIKITTIGAGGVGTGGISDKAVFHVIADAAVNNVALTVTQDPLAAAPASYGLMRGTNYFYKFRIVPTIDNTTGVALAIASDSATVSNSNFWDDGYEIEFWVESTVPLPPVSQNRIVVHGVSSTATADVNINLDSRAFNPKYREI